MGEEEEEDTLVVSRSQRKRDNQALVSLGSELISLAPGQLEKMELPERLVEAIAEARGIEAHGGRKRQLKYLGRLLREIDVDPIYAAMDAIRDRSAKQTGEHHRVERWRDRLLEEGDPALDELMKDHPLADRQHLRQLMQNVVRERVAGKPPRAFRLLFRYLRDLLVPGEVPPEEVEPET
jgi:ribosome-associated protein